MLQPCAWLVNGKSWLLYESDASINLVDDQGCTPFKVRDKTTRWGRHLLSLAYGRGNDEVEVVKMIHAVRVLSQITCAIAGLNA